MKNLERVLAAVDFSPGSADAASWVATHFAPGAEITLLNVVDVPRPPAFLAPFTPDPDEIRANARRRAEQRLRELADSIASGRIRTEVRSGRPADAIAAAAKALRAELVVLGPHDERRGPARALGTVADQVLRQGSVPVLVVRGPPSRPPTTILLPIDASPHSVTAAAWAAAIQAESGARVIGIHAVDPALYGSMRTVGSVLKAGQLRQKVVEATDEWIRRRLSEARVQEPGARAVLGDPRTEILSAIEREGADLVVMGSRGAGGVGRAVLGSLASAVARASSCPLLLVTAAATRART